MFAYIAGVMILLLLWGSALQTTMTWLAGYLKLNPVQAILSWVIVLAVGYALAVLLTELVLPHSALTKNWTSDDLERTGNWSYTVNALVMLAILVRVYFRVWPEPVKVAPAKKTVKVTSKK